MTGQSVPRLVWHLAIPTIISMVTTALYNIVDAAFVGTLSTEGTAGIGVSFAFMTVIQALGFFFGHGSGNYISRALGARRGQQAAVVASVGFFSPLILGLLIALVCLPNLSTLSRLLGAPTEVVPYANDYLRYIVAATPFMMSALTLNNQLRLQGNARFAMIGIVCGAVLNIVLDPIFIFLLNMGVSGASLATAVSQICSWMILVIGTFRPESVHVSFSNFKPSFNVYREILRGGLPSLFRQLFNCAAAISLNYCAALYAAPGSEASAVAAFAVVTRIMMFAFSAVLGFCQGFQPVAGFNYGAGLYERVRQSWLYALKVSALFLTAISVVGFIFAPQIVALFRAEDPTLVAIGAATLRWQCVSFPLISLSTSTNMLFQNIGMTAPATLLSIGRNGMFFLPAVVLLPQVLGLQGVQMAQAVADMLTFCLSVPYAIWINRYLKHSTPTQQTPQKD
ncbi:MAG: MATE family efflux transporter [Bacteroidales bacterium]|nr:MATE family efflux transporter [Bacteroidales bacterium]